MKPFSVTYKKPTLVETIFQLRFSPILQIETEIPASFQERIRHNYPEYSIQNQFHQEISGNLDPTQFVNETRLTTTKVHTFSNQNLQETVNLTRDSISLQTKKYFGWEPFKEHLTTVITTFIDCYGGYSPMRIGLRYINIVDRTRLGLGVNDPWDSLLNEQYLGLMADHEYGPVINSYDVKTNIALPGNIGVNIAVGSVVKVVSLDQCLKLDIDCFLLSFSDDITDDVELLHKNNEKFFFHAITEKLHETMQPS